MCMADAKERHQNIGIRFKKIMWWHFFYAVFTANINISENVTYIFIHKKNVVFRLRQLYVWRVYTDIVLGLSSLNLMDSSWFILMCRRNGYWRNFFDTFVLIYRLLRYNAVCLQPIYGRDLILYYIIH